MELPQFGSPLTSDQLRFIELFARSCRKSILEMVTMAASGHPGGSLSSIDYLSLLYAFRASQTDEAIVVSHGHISPAVYSALAELGVIPKEKVISSFRRPTDIYEGHVNRQIPGIPYGTGPLGIGGSVACGMALANRLEGRDEFTFLLMGDGEQQEGQNYEMMHFAAKYELNRLIGFIDYNQVQLTDALHHIMPIPIAEHYRSAGWNVIDVPGHDFEALWRALGDASQVKDRPTLLSGNTVMGQGVEFMQKTGEAKKADWHGKAPKTEEILESLKTLELSPEDKAFLEQTLQKLPKNIGSRRFDFPKINPGKATIRGAEVFTDCRSAYGEALLDLAKLNPHIIALSADLSDSVKTSLLEKAIPERHFECGIAEQHMVSTAGGFSLRGIVPFASTFGAFMTSRAKDQARVNDINETNVKMVSTHCGLSVGEDGPTHQAIDDLNSFSGFFHTQLFEPADPNQTDHMIRAIATLPGNVYVRMGRAKLPIIAKADGSPFYDENYEFKPGKADLLREGSRATLIAAGPMVSVALKAAEALGGNIDVIAVSSFHPFDKETILTSVRKTGKVLTIHDHELETGLKRFVQNILFEAGICVPTKHLGVKEYQLSGTAEELYELAGMGVTDVVEGVDGLLYDDDK